MTKFPFRLARAALAGVGAVLLSLPVQAADPLLGKEKSTVCAACHGADGNSPSPEFPRIGGQHEDYLLQALLAYKSAWVRDVKKGRVTRDAAMAKMFATEAAQRVVDAAVQICGGLGVTRGHPVERLYREVRALRIYEGATEVQKLIIARDLLKP